MNGQETSRILSLITAVYPSFLKDRDPRILNEVWQRVFAHVPYEQVEHGVCVFLASDTKGFPPTPGAINACIMKSRQLNELTEDEAWRLVAGAAARGIYNSREAFDSLPPEVQKIVCSPAQIHEWAQLDSFEFNSVVAAGFKRSWRARQELKRELGVLSPAPERDRLPDDR